MIDQAIRDVWADWCDVAGSIGAEQSAGMRVAIRDLLAELARLESLYAAATSTADSLEAINEAQVERARRHNAEVQAVVDGARLRHEEDAERIAALIRRVDELESEQTTRLNAMRDTGAQLLSNAAVRDRIKALEVGLREACTGWSWSTVAEVNLKRIAALRKLAGEP